MRPVVLLVVLVFGLGVKGDQGPAEDVVEGLEVDSGAGDVLLRDGFCCSFVFSGLLD